MPEIERIYAWVVTEPDGGEGVPAIKMPVEGPEGEDEYCIMPLMGADRARIESLREFALQCRHMGLPVRLLCFDHRTEIERL